MFSNSCKVERTVVLITLYLLQITLSDNISVRDFLYALFISPVKRLNFLQKCDKNVITEENSKKKVDNGRFDNYK